jgi:oligopeptide/dipeptide ABC transporter ATP-binding protein
LLKSVPVFGKKGKQLVPIEGMVPSPSDEIVGCAFADRCPRVMEVCRREYPELVNKDGDHQVACWLHKQS